MSCILCELINDASKRICEDEHMVAIWDGFPVSMGHALIVPKRHVESLFELTDEELKSAYELIVNTKVILDYKYSPNGYNIGINEGRAAGRTIDHAHIHIIPRYDGDMDDPRGGVRGVIPDKRIY